MDETIREAIDQYISQLFAPEDDALRHIQAEANRNNMPEISIQPFEGRLLQFLAQMANAKKIVEIGTLAGYSAAWLARSLPADGKLISLDVSEKHANVARANLANAKLSDKVEVRQGDARDLLKKLTADAPFDMVFIDADKDSYPFYLEWAIENLRQGGIIAAHNALRHGKIIAPDNDLDRAMAEFNKRIAEDKRLSSFILAIGDGMAVSIKK
jgi:caffeoyl-CoA O-methyltransferase